MFRPIIALILSAATAGAAVTRVDIAERGELSGCPGYERVVGKIHFAVDPELAANRIIVDIGLAPRNAQGLVEFSADLYMLKPVDPARGNGTALLEVSNRGGKSLLPMFDLAGESDPHSAEGLGDRLLFEKGFTLVWVGWEWDVPKRPGIMGLDAPRIPGLTGLVRAEIIRNEFTHRASLGDRMQTPYPVADPDAATMTWRDDPIGPSTVVCRPALTSTPPSVRIGRWAVKLRSVNCAPKRGLVFAQPPAVGPRNEASAPAMKMALKPHDQVVGSSGLEISTPSWRSSGSSPKRFITGATPLTPGPVERKV